jgi:hypothetical protein
MTYNLDEKLIFDAMTDELNRTFKRFSQDVLSQYVSMKVRMTRSGFGPKPRPKTTITHATLKYWVKCFLAKYQSPSRKTAKHFIAFHHGR